MHWCLASDPALPAAARFEIAYRLLQSAQQTLDAGNLNEAAPLFEEAAREYTALMAAFPDWEKAITQYRAEHCRAELASIRAKQTPTAMTVPTAVEPAPGSPATPNHSMADKAAVVTLQRDARLQLRDGRPEAARSLLMDALRLNPDDTGTRLLIAIAQCQLTNYVDARYVLEELIEEQPTNVAAQLTMGLACFGDGEAGKAREHIERALELAPDSADAHFDLARLLATAEPSDRAAAERHYRRALALGAAPDAALDAIFDAVPAESAPSTNAPPAE